MNAVAFGSLLSSACTLGTQGTYGPDRITRHVKPTAASLQQSAREPKMFRLIFALGASLICLSAYNNHDGPPSNADKEPSSLQELLQAHDVEVARRGKDLRYIKPIGRYGREGVLASLDHIEKSGQTISSYNSIELVFGVAEEARMTTGYDICKDNVTLIRLARGKAVNAPVMSGLFTPTC